MAQRQVQTLEQKQTQTFTQQQLLQVHLLELPINQLIERVRTELNDNPALEGDIQRDTISENSPSEDNPSDYETERDKEDRLSALDDALQLMAGDDYEPPVYRGAADDHQETAYGQNISSGDLLLRQMGETALTDRERDIMEYLIGSLDDDGYLRKPLEAIADELAVYHNINVSATDIERVLRILQTFDPAGIGARNLRECLLLQIERKQQALKGERKSGGRLLSLMYTAVHDFFDDFTKKRWKHIRQEMRLSDDTAADMFDELRKLNPKPGAALGEVVGRSMEQITPDFIVDTHDDGTVTFSLNDGDMPRLSVSDSFASLLRKNTPSSGKMSRQMKEALLYTRQKVDAARGFIDAIRQRRHTLIITMRAIIDRQIDFFADGDEASLHPMILRDIAEKTGLDVSTVSRVSNSKYALTRWGLFPLKFFFTDSYTTEKGETLSTRKIKMALKDIVDTEDKHRPLNDIQLVALLTERGYPIARRTVAKYRQQLGIPTARMRTAL